MKKLFVFAFAIFLSGCTLTRGSHTLIGNARPPISPDSVKIYTDPPAKFEKIALVSADSRNDFASQQNLSDRAIRRLKEEAAAVGANGILLGSVGNYQVGTTGIGSATQTSSYTAAGFGASNVRTGKATEGVAIYVPAEK